MAQFGMIRLTTFEFDPYWEQRGWDGDPEGIASIKTSPGSTRPTASSGYRAPL